VHITVVSHSSVRNPLLADVVAVAASLALCDVLYADFLQSFLVRESLRPSAMLWVGKTVCRSLLQLPSCDNNNNAVVL
jgi:hypothetical protein